MVPVPPSRIRDANDASLRAQGDYVLYWMTAFRRPGWNFALEHAVEQARALKVPLVILEALRCDYPWASDRLHRFVLQGMAANVVAFERKPVLHHPFVETRRGAGKGLLAALGERACLVVADDSPSFFLPRMLAAAAKQLDVKLAAVDSNGLMPLYEVPHAFPTAYAFRRFLQAELPPWLTALPKADPLAGVRLPKLQALPPGITRRWPAASAALLAAEPPALAELPIDHGVAPVPLVGGHVAGTERLARFLASGLDRYGDASNHPDEHATSGLSPYLHFGHVSVHQVFDALRVREGWTPGELSSSRAGKRAGWWGLAAPIESFLDQLVTWRELGYTTSRIAPDHARFSGLPAWAQETLREHAADPRPHLYDAPALAAADTYDELWNASQRELLAEGSIHNYLRMLWGKKILEWSASPEAALEVLIELNDRYALDGRDPNSYSGITWILGRYDRPWGPDRPIFGKVRYMTSQNTARKLRLKEYLGRYGAAAGPGPG